jgi:hypothetical protein
MEHPLMAAHKTSDADTFTLTDGELPTTAGAGRPPHPGLIRWIRTLPDVPLGVVKGVAIPEWEDPAAFERRLRRAASTLGLRVRAAYDTDTRILSFKVTQKGAHAG